MFKNIQFIEKEHEDIQDIFQLLDYDNKGYVYTRDVIEILESLGLEVKSNLLYQILKYLKSEGKEKINYDDFFDIMAKKLTSAETDDEMLKNYKMIYGVYKQSDKSVNFDTLKRVQKEIGEHIHDDILRRMIKLGDSSGKGQVNFDDFYEIQTTKYSKELLDLAKKGKSKQSLQEIKN